MRRFRIFFLILIVSTTSMARAATLDVPAPNTILSGIGVVHGWKCEAGTLTVRFNGGPSLPLAYGLSRPDTKHVCGDENNGFVSIMNWAELGDGRHTVVIYDDGVEVARRTFSVATMGEPFVRGAQKGIAVRDFPDEGDEVYIQWNQATQHFELFNFYPGEEPEPEPTASERFAFLLERDGWTIEVPDLYQWRNVSVRPHPTNKVGDLLDQAPADIRFLRYHRGSTLWRDYPAIPRSGVEIVGHIQGQGYIGGRFQPGLPRLVELGDTLDVLNSQLALKLGVFDDRYTMVVSAKRDTGLGTDATRVKDICYILTFNIIWRTDDGGMETQASFYETDRSLRSSQHPWECVPPVQTRGISTRLLIY